MKKLLLIIATVFFIQMSNAQVDSLYLGQTPPGNTAVVFAPGIISKTNRNEVGIAFSPDNTEIYFEITPDLCKIYYTKRINNTWTEPAEAPFSIGRNVAQPFMSTNGNKLYIAYWNNDWSNGGIGMVERTTDGWSSIQRLPSPFNASASDQGYTETSDGVAYINSNRTGGSGNTDIWCIRRLADQSFQTENLGPEINSSGYDVSPFVSPDGSYLIYATKRTGNVGLQDLYICFKKESNSWTTPLNMNSSGSNINVAQYNQMCPLLSPDGKFLFFSRQNASASIQDIYWVSANIIDTLKKIAMPTTLVNQAIDKKVMLYPNPTNGRITLSLGISQNKEAFVEIYNLQGAQVFSKTYKNTPSATIDLTGNSAGMYVVKVIADGVSYEEKIVKE